MGRVVIALLIAGCGRLGFDDDRASDAAPSMDSGDATQMDSDLLLWFPFDGSIANRGSVQAEVACQPACPSTVAGKRIAAGGFDGTTTALRVTDHPDLRVTAGTIAMWLRPTALPPQGEARAAAGVAFGTASLNTWEVYFYGDISGTQLVTGGDAAGDPQLRLDWDRGVGAWIHVAATWDGSTRHRMYVDGVEIASGPQFALLYDDHDLMIGVDESLLGLDHYFDGDIDDVRFYGRELAPPEIAALAAP